MRTLPPHLFEQMILLLQRLRLRDHCIGGTGEVWETTASASAHAACNAASIICCRCGSGGPPSCNSRLQGNTSSGLLDAIDVSLKPCLRHLCIAVATCCGAGAAAGATNRCAGLRTAAPSGEVATLLGRATYTNGGALWSVPTAVAGGRASPRITQPGPLQWRGRSGRSAVAADNAWCSASTGRAPTATPTAPRVQVRSAGTATMPAMGCRARPSGWAASVCGPVHPLLRVGGAAPVAPRRGAGSTAPTLRIAF
mmetsp:Transcript_48703/g.122927  ORF Transcript_48703/g.122927 Transcript_48703/m.122927 type:complete len:254 (-) Transcript_48703:480-1241(-)